MRAAREKRFSILNSRLAGIGMSRTISLKVNGMEYKRSIEPRVLLVELLRDELSLTGTKIGCEVGKCGACTVMFNGKSVKSCMVFSVQTDGGDVLTVEGLADPDRLHPIQEAFWENHALQCGYCTPGMLVSTYFLLKQNSDPSEEEVRKALAGNLCTCTGYANILKAVREAGERIRGKKQ